MKAALNIIILLLTATLLWQLEVQTQLPADEVRIANILALIPFLAVAIYGRLHITEVTNALNKKR